MSPRTAFTVQGASNKTRWVLDRRHDTPVHSPSPDSERVRERGGSSASMQSNGNGHYFDGYGSYHGRNASVSTTASSQISATGWKPPSALANGAARHEQEPYDYASALDPRSSYQMSLNTSVKGPHQADLVGQHLLYETALMDCQGFDILDIAKVDALKKEHVRLNSRIEAAQRKLQLETKVKDAAQNLQRLYSGNGRPDTPQSPESPKRSRASLLGGRQGRSSSGGEALAQTDSELAASVKKVEELQEQVKQLLERRQYVEGTLLRHTAAVLADQANRDVQSAVPGLHNGHHRSQSDDEDDDEYSPDEFDGIRDILRGLPAGSRSKLRQHEQQMGSLQDRLEQLNVQLRGVITEAGRTLGKPVAGETPYTESEDSTARVEDRIVRMEDNLHALEQQQREISSEYTARSTTESQLLGVSRQVHGALQAASEGQSVPGLQPPPSLTGHSYEGQIEYLHESLMAMDHLLQQHGHALQTARDENDEASRAIEDAHSKAATSTKKASEYETVVTGLWEILQSVSLTSGTSTPREGDSGPASPALKESFSLQTFSAHVQHLFDKVQGSREQQDILRRQIQQQRELNSQSDAEKDDNLANLQTQHDQLNNEHEVLQQELANTIVQHERTTAEAQSSRSELMNVANELDSLKRTVDERQAERDELTKSIQNHQTHAATLQDQVTELESQITQLQSADEALRSAQQTETEKLESEVVRLTTELAMSKAELDGAYGSRAERAGAQAATVEALQTRNTAIEQELHEMTQEYQDLTKESLELEREREQLDTLIDSLRDRCDVLEAQLGDEKVRWLGMKSPTGAATGPEGFGRELTSMTVLRQEFKKMMRDSRAEGVKLLRAEQEERRRLESELRKLRQANGPLSKSPRPGAGTPAAVAGAP